MRRNRLFVALVLVVGFVFALNVGFGTGDALAEDTEGIELVLVDTVEVFEETGATLGEINDTIEELNYEEPIVINTDGLEGYLEGEIDDILDLDLNEKTDEVMDIVGEDQDLEDAVEMDEVVELTDEVLEELDEEEEDEE